MTSPADRIPAALAAELSRQYDILRLLGLGGMGAVWLARERSLDRLVAIKVLAGADIGIDNVRERFRREARIAAKLVHPNIVPLHAFGETPDALYFAMGYVEGESLATRVEREGRLSRSAAQRVLEEIADALAFAHREGVVHRDVKPENILLDAKTGRAMLADFGIARIEDAATSVTMTGVAVGTPSYMSPEQAVGAREIDGRSDLYSLGVVGYRMLLGRLPFVAASGQALMAQHAMAKPDDLTLAVPPGDRGVASIIMRALEKEPAARWAKAEDFREELQSLGRNGTALPEELQRVQTIGTKVLFADLVIAGIFGLSTFWDPGWMVRVGSVPYLGAGLLFLGNLAFLPVLSLGWAYPTARKFGWRDTLRAMLHPPESWAHWWPRSWRRPDDIWDRLPAPFRRLRNVLDGVVTWLVLDIAAFMVTASTGGGAWGDLLLSVMRTPGGFWLVNIPKFVAFGWIGFEFLRARRMLGVNSRELAELLALPHLASHAGWSKPKFARLLASEGSETPAVRPPQTPDELARAIKELTDRLVRMGFLPDAESVSAAESVRAAIEGLESEIQLLHARFDPAEGDRLAKRLAALGASDDDAELRPLLEGQQAVLRRLDQRRHDKEARRDRLRDQLVTLWMQLLELNARLSRGAAADLELTGRVQALSRELAHVDEAMTEVEQVLKPAPDRPRVTT